MNEDLLPPIVATVERWHRAGLVDRRSAAELRDRLDSPLRVAVAGRVSTGKSTIVNALLHKAVAATGPGEVTRLVSLFRHGFPERVSLITTDERFEVPHVHFPLDDSLPLPRGLDPRRISHLEVTLPLDRMRSVTVVDTPGLQSGSRPNASQAGRLLGVRRAGFDDGVDRVAAADAVLYVVGQDVRADDADAIDDFVAATGGGPAGYGRVVAVLNRLDACGGIDAPDSVRLRDQHAGELGGRIVDVVPMVANLAETALAGRLTQAMIDDLIRLTALDVESSDLIWHDVEYFQADAGLEAARATALVTRLGMFGIRLAVALIRSSGYDPVALHAFLVRASGIDRLVAHLDDVAARGDLLKARSGLAALVTLAWAGGADAQARDDVAALRADVRYHVLDELEVLDELVRGALTLDGALEAQAIAVLTPGGDEQRLERLGQPSRHDLEHWMDGWLGYENTCSTTKQAAAARRVHRRLARLRAASIELATTTTRS